MHRHRAPKGEAPELMEMQRGFKDTIEGTKAAKTGAEKGAVQAKQKRKEAQEKVNTKF